MTQLQIEFNKLRETERANRMSESLRGAEVGVKSKEASIKEAEVHVKEAETKLKQMKAPYEIQQMVSNANLNDVNSRKAVAQIDEILGNIQLLSQKTGLTQAEKQREQVALTNDIMSLAHRTTGINYVGDMEDTLTDWIGKILGGASKVIGGALIG